MWVTLRLPGEPSSPVGDWARGHIMSGLNPNEGHLFSSATTSSGSPHRSGTRQSTLIFELDRGSGVPMSTEGDLIYRPVA